MAIEGITITEMAEILNLKRHAVEQRLIAAGIKPITYEAVYPLDALEKIKDIKRGRRPRKQPPGPDPAPEPEKPAKKGKK